MSRQRGKKGRFVRKEADDDVAGFIAEEEAEAKQPEQRPPQPLPVA